MSKSKPSPPAADQPSVILEFDTDQVEVDTRKAGANPPPDADYPDDPTTLAEPQRQRHPTIPGLFARNSVNLIIGSTNSGKTVLALSSLERYATEGVFLDWAIPEDARPEQLAAIVCAKTLDALHRHVRSLKLQALGSLIHFPMRDWKIEAGETLRVALDRLYRELCHQAQRKVRFLYVEGLQLMMESSSKINDPLAVKEFFSTLNDFLLTNDCTILATVPQAKLRRGESYPRLGDRIYGSVSWGSEADTLIGIEQTRMDLEEERRPSYRRIVVQRPNKTTKVVWADFDEQGRLAMVDGVKANPENPAFAHLDQMLNLAPPGTQWRKDELIRWGEDYGLSRRTVERWLASRSDPMVGMLEAYGSTRRKFYRKPTVQ